MRIEKLAIFALGALVVGCGSSDRDQTESCVVDEEPGTYRGFTVGVYAEGETTSIDASSAGAQSDDIVWNRVTLDKDPCGANQICTDEETGQRFLLAPEEGTTDYELYVPDEYGGFTVMVNSVAPRQAPIMDRMLTGSTLYGFWSAEGAYISAFDIAVIPEQEPSAPAGEITLETVVRRTELGDCQ